MYQSQYEHILVPMDGSDSAEKVLPYVQALALEFGARVTLLRAVATIQAYAPATGLAPLGTGPMIGSPVTSTHPMGLDACTDPYEMVSAERQAADDCLRGVVDRLRGAGPRVEHERVVEGAAAKAIVEWAAIHHLDLIAMTTHGRGGLERAIVGSVADEVVRKAHCPVLLVRGS